MTKIRAYEIATAHTKHEIGSVSWYPMADGRNLHIQTLYEPGYFDSINFVTYIDAENDDGDCIETHTTTPDNVDDMMFWIHEMFYDVEEKEMTA